MRDSLSVLLEMFVAGSTTPAGTVAAKHAMSIISSSVVSIIHSCLFSSTSVRDSYISTMLSKELPSARCRRWHYEDIKEARFMRFLLEVKHANANNPNPDFLNMDLIRRFCLHRIWLEDIRC